MIERLLLILLVAAALIILYRLWNVWQIQRVALTDPLLNHFSAGIPGVVLFTADYCAPCKFQQRPALQRLLEQVGGVQIIEVNVETDPDAAQRWGVMSLPTTYILDKTGTPRAVNHGVTSAEKLKQQLEALS
ncbi:MAG: thioredoxin family protein [Anaerolineae bacterium]|jgi:thioredoxin-like negative regulator of GroEL|nr:thioredoxin family protein [Anaerolineae bacterium]